MYFHKQDKILWKVFDIKFNYIIIYCDNIYGLIKKKENKAYLLQ